MPDTSQHSMLSDRLKSVFFSR